MIELVILTQQERNENNGEYLPNKIIEPIKISNGIFVLNRSLAYAHGLESHRNAILLQPYFVVGDGSDTDLIYQEYLAINSEN